MARTIGYWIATSLTALAYLAFGYFDIAQPKDVLEGAAHLGYPLYFFTILGCWKLAAAIALLAPGVPRLKEWTYAGIFFNLTGAATSHAVLNDPIGNIATPLVVLAIAIASWTLRPASRKLAGPWI